MKTIKDVIAAYPDGWPSIYERCYSHPHVKDRVRFEDENGYSFGLDGEGVIAFPSYGWRLICTREEYEQALYKQKATDVVISNVTKMMNEDSLAYRPIENMQYNYDEVMKSMETLDKADWYDYERNKAIDFPFDGEMVQYLDDDGKWIECKYIHNKPERFRPLDHDKHQVKTVSLDWLVGSGIDCEFSDSGNEWCVASLNRFGSDWYQDEFLGSWKQCRPRMNKPMVLTDEQVNLIPDGFDYTCEGIGDFRRLVTFKGLKDGYKYEWED